MSEDVDPENEAVEENSDVEAQQEELSDDQAPVEDDAATAEQEATDESPDEESADQPEPEPEPQPEPATPEFEADYGDEYLNQDIRSLLDPISDDAPCGESDIEAESVIAQIEANIEPVFDSIKSDFSTVVENDDMSGFDPQLSGSEASKLNDQAFECLRENCKSLILCSQLPKLLMISHGLTGFRAGLEVYRAMIEFYGDKLFPQDKERASQYFRGGVYIGNDDKVTETFRLFLFVPVTEQKQLVYALLRNSRLIKANPGVETRYGSDASSSSPEFYVKLIGDIEGVIEACNLANAATAQYIDDASVQPEIVSFQFIKSLEKMKAIVTNLATEHCVGYPPVEEEESAQDEGGEGAAQIKAAQGEIVNREQAIELLQKIADFFQRTERHSPVSYSIRKLLEWTKMDLPELMEELLDGSSEPLSEFAKRTGIKPKSDEDSDTF